MQSTENAIVTFKDVDFYRGERAIFKSLSLHIPRGKITGIMGPSGCGKTTLLRLIGAQLKPEAGEIRLDDHIMHRLPRAKLYRLRQQIGMLFQSNALFTNISVFDNVAFPIREHTKLPEAMIRDIVLMKLEAVGLRGARDLMPSELSGGMARRVALARAIALDPDLVMYDEPFTGQDPIMMGILLSLIRKLNDALGLTSIIVSHDVTELLDIADYIYVLADGGIIGEGTPEQIRQDTSPRLHQFIHGLPDGVVPFHYPASAVREDFLA